LFSARSTNNNSYLPYIKPNHVPEEGEKLTTVDCTDESTRDRTVT
jgi:hypothetical protein